MLTQHRLLTGIADTTGFFIKIKRHDSGLSLLSSCKLIINAELRRQTRSGRLTHSGFVGIAVRGRVTTPRNQDDSLETRGED